MCAWKQDNPLQGKCIAVAGASCGVGYALARRLAEEYGAQVIAIGRRRLYRIEALSRSLGTEQLWVCAGDMSVQSEAQDVLRRSEERFGHLDAYVHTIRRHMPLNALNMTESDFHLAMRVNVKSALFGIQAAVPHLQHQQSSAIIFYNPRPARARLAADAVTLAANYALSALTSGWAEQLHKCGIIVREVTPQSAVAGFSQTEDALHEKLLLETLISALQVPPYSPRQQLSSSSPGLTVLTEHGGLTLTQF